MRRVADCTRRTSASCASVVSPGLSDRKSLPCSITLIPSGARSSGVIDDTTSWIDGSSRIARSSLFWRAAG